MSTKYDAWGTYGKVALTVVVLWLMASIIAAAAFGPKRTTLR